MNRILLTVAGVFSASSLLLVDAAIKGSVLLLLAAVAAIVLKRDSAATRHLVWLLAMVAMLTVPVLSAMLPQWQVLPEWAKIPATTAVGTSPPTIGSHPAAGAEVTRTELPNGIETPPQPAYQPSDSLPDSMPAAVVPQVLPARAILSWDWRTVMPLAWSIGFCLLILRLMAARWVLGNTERQGTFLGNSTQPLRASDDSILAALQAASLQLGMRQPVSLLIHPGEMIPVVWGIFRYRLLLPAVARQWDSDQLRSVLLHELAHIQRRDTLVQLLTQLACALHWFNPLVWFAAWRLGVERERACDDLVLASGVRASAYAGHLLDVVTRLLPARWTQACGLAMARKSSLEGRLAAVLTQNLNRRRVSLVLAEFAVMIAVGVAVPLAMLRAADEKRNPPHAAHVSEPKHEYAQSLFNKWKAYARTDGKIPGALIGQLVPQLDNFVEAHPADEKARQLLAIRPRLDATHDWAPADVVALLDEISAISTLPVSWVDFPLQLDEMRNVKLGQPLPAELTTAAWGTPAANGLRAAWLLEPRAEQYPLGSVLKPRVLFHNTGKEPVVFTTETWHQDDPHTARAADGAEITVSGTWYTGVTPSSSYRLEPGKYCAVLGHGIAIGAGKYEEERSVGSVGAIIEAKAGDEVRLSHSVDTTYGVWTRPNDLKEPGERRKLAIADRIGREAPLPPSAADREQLIRRVTLDIFGEPPSAEEVSAFIADNAPDALAKLIARLQTKPRIEPCSGKLPTGEAKFRVIAADPNAAKAPRTANGPGRYVLGDNVHLQVTQITADGQRTNKAKILFFTANPKVVSPYKPYEIALEQDFAFVWERGSQKLWVTDISDGARIPSPLDRDKDLPGPKKVTVRTFDFTDPAEVKLTHLGHSENGSTWSWAKLMPQQFQTPVIQVLGEKGKRLLEFVQPQEPQQPQDDKSRPLFENWKSSARRDGKIPGGRIGEMAASLKTFIDLNPGHEKSVKFESVLKKCDASRDWTPAEAAALLDEIAGITPRAQWALRTNTEREIRPGKPLPDKLADAPWGKPAANGLRIAWLLEPRAETQALDSVMTSRVLFHNTGKAPVSFATWAHILGGGHKAQDASAKDIIAWGDDGGGFPLRRVFRLAPGEYAEVEGDGIGVGSRETAPKEYIYQVIDWIEAKAGDAVTFTPRSVAVSFRTWQNNEGPKDSVTVWQEMIAGRVMQESPLPAAADREQLLRRVIQTLFGTEPSSAEMAAFVADNEPDALARLIKSLQARAADMHFAGELSGGETKFRVTAAVKRDDFENCD